MPSPGYHHLPLFILLSIIGGKSNCRELLIFSSARVAMLLASIAEAVYSYYQVTFHLVQR